MNREKCIKVIKWYIRDSRLEWQNRLDKNDPDNKETCKDILDHLDQAVKYLETNLK